MTEKENKHIILISGDHTSNGQYAALLIRRDYNVPILPLWTDRIPQTQEADCFATHKSPLVLEIMANRECFNYYKQGMFTYCCHKDTIPALSSHVLPLGIALYTLKAYKNDFDFTSILVRSKTTNIFEELLENQKEEKQINQTIDDKFDYVIKASGNSQAFEFEFDYLMRTIVEEKLPILKKYAK